MGLGFGSISQGQTCVLVEAVWAISCISSGSKSSCSLTVSCSQGTKAFLFCNSACYKVKGDKLLEDWKVEIHPLPRFLHMGQLQSRAFYGGDMAMMDVYRKMI